MDAVAETVAEVCGGAREGMTSVEMAEAFEDNLQLKDFLPCGRLRGERGGAGAAVPALHDCMTVAPPPCSHNLGAMAEDAALKVCANEWRSER